MDGDTVRCILLGAVILGGIGLIYILVPDAHVMMLSVVQTTGSR
jgi:hypothetical protein